MKKIFLPLFCLLSLVTVAQQPARIIIDTEGEVHPWSNLDVNNEASTFQFAIVSDRTGGHRPGVFPIAIDKLNLLQPEFVMSVGDLIEGYTEDEARIDREWEEFTGFIDKLEVPFFYVPGNHDYINDVMAKKWKERFGKDYYHFQYKDVLFLCLNSEERKRGAGRGYIDQPQYDYIKETLADNQDVKWTLVFMHQPLWDQEDSGMWEDVEELLKDRKHTVYVGHRHRYVRYERNDSKYFILATTGGGSGLRGPAFGEFDHVVWITMTDNGPIMANLLLDGIWDENVQTEALLKRNRELTQVDILEITPLMAKDGLFEGGELVFRFDNPADIPLEVELEVAAHDKLFIAKAPEEIEIPPNSVRKLSIPVKTDKALQASTLEVLEVEIEYTYAMENAPELSWEKEINLAPIDFMGLSYSVKPYTIDGSLGEWSGLNYKVEKPFVDADPFSHSGKKDASFDFDIAYDDDYVYMAMKVVDDEMRLSETGNLYSQDAAFIQVDARPLDKLMNGEVGRYFRDWTILAVAPSPDGSAKLFRENNLPEGIKVACQISDKGYTIEAALPIAYVKAMQGENWKHLRINAGVHDIDKEGEHDATLFWRPDWRGEDNILGSGMFRK